MTRGVRNCLSNLARTLPALIGLYGVMLADPAARATTYYVSSAQGADDASGLSAATPFRRFDQAMDRLRPGDRLVIEGGHYDEALMVTRSGTATEAIEIGGGDGPLPEIRSENDAVAIAADYVRLSRIDAASTGELGSAIVVQPGHHHVTITDAVAHDSGCGGIAGLQTDYLTIRHNRVYGNGKRSPWQCSGISIYQAANLDEAPGFHNVIDGNLVYGNTNVVPDPKLPARLAGHTTDGNGIIIDDFRHDQLWRGQRTAPYRSATLIENNAVRGNGGRGIEVFHGDDVTLRNNTVSGNLLDPHMVSARYGEVYAAYAAHIRLFNNLVAPGGSAAYAIMAAKVDDMQADYNVTIGASDRSFGRDAAEAEWGGHNFAAAQAGFADDGRDDLHLTAASAARGRGAAAHAPAADLDGQPRPHEGAVDAGAFQSKR